MELWQLDVMGGVRLVDGTELKAVTGIDDHSRYCVAFGLVERATARPVCTVFARALRTHGIPEEVLTDIQRQSVHRPPRSARNRCHPVPRVLQSSPLRCDRTMVGTTTVTAQHSRPGSTRPRRVDSRSPKRGLPTGYQR
jgi:hypothetical protein